MEEIWKDIEGFEGIYQVSSFGRVRSITRKQENGLGRIYIGKIKTQSKTKWGYLCVHLCKNGKYYCPVVHRLVAKAFIPNPDNLPCVNHKSEIRTENRVENLEWCTYLYNNNYGTRKDKLSKAQKNSDYIQNKQIPVYQFDKQGNFIASYPSSVEAAEAVGASSGNIRNGCKKGIYHKGFVWSYSRECPPIRAKRGPYKLNYSRFKAIEQYKDGVLIATYKTAADAERETGVGHSRITSCCKGKISQSSGYIWKYKINQ